MKVDAVLIAGPTASGKSAAAMALAEHLSGAVINTDSMQVYREARVLTARPSAEDEARLPHRLYGHISVHQSYSVARYQADAKEALADAQGSDRLPIFVGGTGLYFGALTDGLADIPPVPIELRAAVATLHKEIGPGAFHSLLRARDPESASRLRATDTQRVLRAFEVFEATRRPLSEWQRGMPVPGPLAGLPLARFVIAPERGELYSRIDARFDRMIEGGAIEEVAALANVESNRPAAKILGRRELLAVQLGKMSLEEAKSAAKTASRQYAKRQLTWFRNRFSDWVWTTPKGNFLTETLPYIE